MIKVYQSPAPLGQRALMANRDDWLAIANSISGQRFHQPPAAMAIRRSLARTDAPLVRIILNPDDAEEILRIAQG